MCGLPKRAQHSHAAPVLGLAGIHVTNIGGYGPLIPYSHLRHHQRQNLRERIPLKKPFTILFDPSSICNFRCIQCFQSVHNVSQLMKKGIMRYEHFTRIVDDFKVWDGPKLKVIRFIGFGEPFLNKELPRMLRYAKQASLADRMEITSNCSLLTPTLSEQLVEHGLDYLRVSIYSPYQEKHEAVTHSAIDIRVIYDNLLRLQNIKLTHKSDRPFVYIKMLDTFDERENRAFFTKYSTVADEILIEKPHNWLDMPDKDFLRDLYKGKKEEVMDRIKYEATLKHVCPQPFKMMSIRFNGDVVVCDPDWLNHTKVGNALEQSVEEIWNGTAMFEFRRMQIENRRHENPSCRACNTFLTDNYTVDNIDGIPLSQLARKA
ncbi:MAG: radical SAM/SPASM domain-containing protein [Thermodesulfobacteriota bacterium]